MKLITFEDKVATKTSSADRKNCVTDDDINDIKQAINENSNVLVYSQTETLIGIFNQAPLYRKIIKINKNDVTPTNNYWELNIEDLVANEVFVDFTHSYFYEQIDYEGETYNEHRPIQFTSLTNASTMTNFKNNTLSVLDFDQETVSFWIGNAVNFDYIILTLEYTRVS